MCPQSGQSSIVYGNILEGSDQNTCIRIYSYKVEYVTYKHDCTHTNTSMRTRTSILPSPTTALLPSPTTAPPPLTTPPPFSPSLHSHFLNRFPF